MYVCDEAVELVVNEEPKRLESNNLIMMYWWKLGGDEWAVVSALFGFNMPLNPPNLLGR